MNDLIKLHFTIQVSTSIINLSSDGDSMLVAIGTGENITSANTIQFIICDFGRLDPGKQLKPIFFFAQYLNKMHHHTILVILLMHGKS